MEELQEGDMMQVEITTLGAGTYDGEIPMKTEEEIAKALNRDGFILLQTNQSGLIVINKSNIVSIKRKR